MATLVLQTAGAAIGGMFGPAGAVVGRALGGLAGAAIDQAFLAGGRAPQRLRTIDVTAATEGTPIARVWGRARVPGQIIWTTRVEAVRTQERSGGKSGGGAAPSGETVRYFANVALGLCEGEISRIGRIWADGKPLDVGSFTLRVHTGTEEQEPDPLIVAKEGAENAPAYRGLAYVVFERMPLEAFGNRVPQLAFEVIRPVGRLESDVRAVTLIPGSTEFGYDTVRVQRVLGIAESVPENQHTGSGETDFVTSVDELQAVCPNLKHVSLVIAWFGDDLRAGHCTVRPKVDSAIKTTSGAAWSVAGLSRAAAQEVSRHDDRPAFGGSPSDASVIRAIQELKARGIGVTLYPFPMMDIPHGNGLPDPATGVAPQPVYPWRGLIRAAGDGTAEAAAEVAHFFGLAEAGDFDVTNGKVVYSGPGEWSWRRCVLHTAHLGAVAGGVDAIIIGSEFRSLTRTRDAAGDYPATEELIALAAEVRAALGGAAKITYAADWTEYGAHVLGSGTEVRFPLDPFWADVNVDAVGIDFYPPLADWRDGAGHRDLDSAESIYGRAYLAANVTGGEAFDWHYASDADRAAQARTPITDGLGKPWIYRAKDIRSWWSKAHYERTGGAELAIPTAWVPESKPVWLTETGCPAVDKGANAPNVFPDLKSGTPELPHFSSGSRDDLIQRRMLEAVLEVYGDASGENPVSPLYGGHMVDPDRTALWTWDARPYPAFPLLRTVWADGAAHETGHWLTGRLGQTSMAELAAAILEEGGAGAFVTDALEGTIDGYAIDRPASAREALEPLADLFGFGVRDRAGTIVLTPRGRGAVRVLSEEDLAADGDAAAPHFMRAQESELPREIAAGYSDPSFDFQPRIAAARMRGTQARGIATIETAISAPAAEMQRRTDIRLQDLWIARDTARFALAPSDIAPEPGDAVALDIGGGEARLFEIGEIAEGPLRRVTARAIVPDMLTAPRLPSTPSSGAPPGLSGPPEVRVLDLPASGGDPPVLSRVAVAAKPWPGSVVFWKEEGGSFRPAVRAETPAVIGETTDAFAAGPAWRFDRAAEVTVTISDGELNSASDERLYAGANLCALQNPDGAWEVLQFGRAELLAPSTYRLSHFLRGQLGTEHEADIAKPGGSAFVLLDVSVIPLVRGIEALGRPATWRAAAAGRDHADPFAVAFTAEPQPVALRPLAPVHVRARRDPDGIAISWIRRDRINADTWEVSEIAMSEAGEAYRIEVLGSGAVLRTLETSEPAALYGSAAELADFGAPQTTISLRIAQISALTGPGRAAEVTLNV